jgi:ribonuclease HI
MLCGRTATNWCSTSTPLRQNWLLHIASQVQMVVESIVKPAIYMQSNGSTIHIKWEPLPARTLKFNVDEAHYRRKGFSACGGVLRDAYGSLIQGFSCNLGRNNSQGAEMWSLVHAMRIARHLHVDRVIFETDSNLIATAVLNRSTTISYLKPLLEEVLNLLNLQDWSATIQHCFREANSCADLLPKKDLMLLSPRF